MKSLRIAKTLRRIGAHLPVALVIMTVALILAAGSQSVFAAYSCMKVKATEVAGFTSQTTVGGIVTNGGILNGTSEGVLAGAFLPGPSPTVVTFNIEKSFITDKGILRTHSPHMLDVATGVGTAFAYVDPQSSTGIFAGASGLLYINFKGNADGVSSTASITGDVCFAN